jgi:hypothetical protein
MLKKKIKFVFLFICTIVLILSSVYAAQQISIYINGEERTDLSPQNINNSVYLPVRALSEALGAEVSWNQDNKTVEVNSDIKLIASIPKNKIYLYALNEENGLYNGVILSINGKKKVFSDWSNITNPSFKPELKYEDVNNDGKDEMIVILTSSEGTGIYIENIHIINPEDFTEYNVEDAIEVVQNKVKTKILSNNEAEIDINGIIGATITIPDNLKYSSENISYRNNVTYEIENSNLIATVGIDGGNNNYLGFIKIDYRYVDGKFISNSLTFEKESS